jgi:O-antigen ligase
MIIFISLYFTFSYGAWLSVLFSIFVVFCLSLPKKKFTIAGIFAIFLMFLLIFESNSQKFSDLYPFSERSSSASREMIWKASFLILKQNPILGIGSGNFQSEYLENQKFFPPYLEWAVPQPHNVFLAFWIQTGILGFLGFLLLLFFIFKNAYLTIKKDDYYFRNLAVISLLGFFLYTIIHGFIDTTYWKNDLSFIFWISIFLLTYTSKQRSS